MRASPSFRFRLFKTPPEELELRHCVQLAKIQLVLPRSLSVPAASVAPVSALITPLSAHLPPPRRWHLRRSRSLSPRLPPLHGLRAPSLRFVVALSRASPYQPNGDLLLHHDGSSSLSISSSSSSSEPNCLSSSVWSLLASNGGPPQPPQPVMAHG